MLELSVLAREALASSESAPHRANLYLRLDTHFTAYGHAATAATIAMYLEARGYVSLPTGRREAEPLRGAVYFAKFS